MTQANPPRPLTKSLPEVGPYSPRDVGTTGDAAKIAARLRHGRPALVESPEGMALRLSIPPDRITKNLKNPPRPRSSQTPDRLSSPRHRARPDRGFHLPAGAVWVSHTARSRSLIRSPGTGTRRIWRLLLLWRGEDGASCRDALAGVLIRPGGDVALVPHRHSQPASLRRRALSGRGYYQDWQSQSMGG